MKRILIAMAVAFAAAATFADKLQGTQGTSFEALNDAGKTVFGKGSGADFGPGITDAGAQGNSYWYMANDAIVGALTNYEAGTGMAYEGELPAAADSLTPATEGWYINLDAPERIERTATNELEENLPKSVDLDGVYVDTMVQFTTTYERPEINTNLTDNGKLDKIAIWLYAPDGDDNKYGDETNLVVTAGYIEGTRSVAKDYVIPNTNIEIEPGKWYRLTVKAIGGMTNSSNTFPGFVVFIDGEAVCTTEGKWDTAVDAGDYAKEVANNLTTAAAKWNDDGALFPSIDISSTARDTFTAAGFIGTGAIDDVTITAEAPAFAADASKVYVTWTAGIGTLTIGGQTPSGFVAGQAGSAELDYSEAASYAVVATPYSSDYNIGDWTQNGAAVTPEATGNGYSYQFEPGEKGEISIGFTLPVAKVGDTPYNSLEDAFAAAAVASAADAPAKVTLLDNVELADGEDGVYLNSGNVILDLNGKTISAADGATLNSSPISVSSGAKLQIISSVAGGAIAYPEGEEGAILLDGAVFTLGAASGDAGVTINGLVYSYDYEGETIKIYRGTLSDGNAENFLENNALKAAYVPEELETAPTVELNTPAAGFFTISCTGGATSDEYTSPDGTSKFTISGEVTLPAGKALGDTAVTIDGTDISYAAAYALGLYDPENPDEIKDIVVQIQIVDGKVVLANSLEDNSNYVVTVKYEKRTDLKTGEWTEVADTANIAVDSENGKGFFRIKVSAIGIADKE